MAIGELMGHKSDRLLPSRICSSRRVFPCQLSDDIRRSKWEKMCWNCVFNPFTVMIDDKVAKALDHPEMAGVIQQIVGEVAAVSAALKVPLAAGHGREGGQVGHKRFATSIPRCMTTGRPNGRPRSTI